MSRLRDALISKDALHDFCKNNEMLLLCYDQSSSKKLLDLTSSYDTSDEFKKRFSQSVYDILNRDSQLRSITCNIHVHFFITQGQTYNSEKEHFKTNLRDFSQGLATPSHVFLCYIPGP